MRHGGLQLESALRIATPTFLGKQATLIGKSLGPYNIIGQLGAGGMGEVCDPQMDAAASAMITVVVNWFKELKQQVPRQ